MKQSLGWFIAGVAITAALCLLWRDRERDAARDQAREAIVRTDSVVAVADSLEALADSLAHRADSVRTIRVRIPVPDTTLRDSLRYWRETAEVAIQEADGWMDAYQAERKATAALRGAVDSLTTALDRLVIVPQSDCHSLPILGGCVRLGGGLALGTDGRVRPALAAVWEP